VGKPPLPPTARATIFGLDILMDKPPLPGRIWAQYAPPAS